MHINTCIYENVMHVTRKCRYGVNKTLMVTKIIPIFFRSKRHIGQKESEISIFFQKSSTVIYKHNCESFSLEKKIGTWDIYQLKMGMRRL